MKTDKELGKKVGEYLMQKGVETPFAKDRKIPKHSVIESAFAIVMQELGLDLLDDSLKDTPKRVAKMYIDEIFYGLNYDNFPKCTAVENKMNYNAMVIERNISVQSNCEHHFVIIDGACAIGYIPNEKVIGLSKLNRIVKFFSKRPQIQERLTEQIFYALEYILDTSNIVVYIKATHYCVKSRGVEDANSDTITSKIGGVFNTDNAARNEFLNLIKI